MDNLEDSLEVVYKPGNYDDMEELAKSSKILLDAYYFDMGSTNKMRKFYFKNISDDADKKSFSKKVYIWKPSDYDLALCPAKGIEIKGINEKSRDHNLGLTRVIFKNGEKYFSLQDSIHRKSFKVYLNYKEDVK